LSDQPGQSDKQAKPTITRKLKFGMSPNVFFLGLVSLFTDISSEMIFTLVPLSLENVLGATTTIIGLIGGLSDSTEGVFKIFSGWFSDHIRKPKLLTVFGYGFFTPAVRYIRGLRSARVEYGQINSFRIFPEAV
jgi:hypothetical protein